MNLSNIVEDLEDIALQMAELAFRLKVMNKKQTDPARKSVDEAKVSENPKKRNSVSAIPKTPAAVKRWLSKQNFNAQRFCQAADVAPSTYYTWLRNGPNPSSDSVTPRIVKTIEKIQAGEVKP